MTSAMSITAYAGTKEENVQSEQLLEAFRGELSEYEADVKNWLSEELSKEENMELFENTEEMVKKSIGNSVAGFFKDMGNRLKGFFMNIFS